MSNKTPKITLLQPVVMSDQRRVSLELKVENLPTTFSNIMLMPDLLDDAPGPPPKPDRDAPSPYPNIELSILNSQHQQVATLYIVEHKEPETALTLHLRAPDATEQYTARAEMTYQDETLEVVEVPFRLNG
jgi:hypothetical protein